MTLKQIQTESKRMSICQCHVTKQFLGMVGYVHKFIPNLSEITKPLRALLTKEVAWHWQYKQKAVFDFVKDKLKSFAGQ